MDKHLRMCIGCGKSYFDLEWLQDHCPYCNSEKTKPFEFQLCFIELPGQPVSWREYNWNSEGMPHTSDWIKGYRKVREAQRTNFYMIDIFSEPQFKWFGMIQLYNRDVVVEGWTSDPHGHPHSWTAMEVVDRW